MHVRFVVNILDTKNCTQSALKPHNKSPETRMNAGFPSSIFIQTPDRQYGVLTHIDDFKGFLTS